MKFMRIIILILSLFVLLSACQKKASEPELSGLTEDIISGEILWNRITVESDWTSYSEWPQHEGLQPGQSPHGTWHRVYANQALFTALPVEDGIAPSGSIIVKENFDNNKVMNSVTVMAKVDGWDPDNGDWFWAMYSSDGEVRAEGSPGGCISCHEGMRSNDFVIINPLDEAP